MENNKNKMKMNLTDSLKEELAGNYGMIDEIAFRFP